MRETDAHRVEVAGRDDAYVRADGRIALAPLESFDGDAARANPSRQRKLLLAPTAITPGMRRSRVSISRRARRSASASG